MGHRGYSGNHPRYSKHSDERYDAKEAYNKDLTASARLHYLENDRHDHESPAHSHCSPMHRHTDKHIRREAKQIARKNEGDEQDIYYELKTQIDDERSRGAAKEGRKIGKFLPKNDERSGEIRNKMIDEMIDYRPDSPMNACAKSEGGSGCIKQMGGAWRVISNKTDKPWPAKYASRSKAEAALRGYHAG